MALHETMVLQSMGRGGCVLQCERRCVAWLAHHCPPLILVCSRRFCMFAFPLDTDSPSSFSHCDAWDTGREVTMPTPAQNHKIVKKRTKIFKRPQSDRIRKVDVSSPFLPLVSHPTIAFPHGRWCRICTTEIMEMHAFVRWASAALQHRSDKRKQSVERA